MKMIGLLLFFVLTLMVSGPVPAQTADVERARAILRKIDDLWRSTSSTARLKMVVNTRHYTRTLVLDSWSKGNDKSLVRIVAPLKEKGTASLKNGSSLYTYLPKTDRIIRLTSGMMMGSWMGSHFTNDDLVKESRLSDDYNPLITFEGLRDGKEVIDFTLIPKPNAPVVWGKIVTTVRSQDFLPLVSLYYDEDMALARTLYFTDIREMGGRKLPLVLRMVPADKKDEYTELTYETINFGMRLDDSFFSLLQLQRL